MNNIPVTILERKHFQNLRYILDRQELLSLMPKSGVCAELGVASGAFSQEILNITSPKKLHLVDSWDSDRYSKQAMETVLKRMRSEINDGKVMVSNGISTEVLQQFNDSYFDWVYIDTDHSYETTISELYHCDRKVKENGIITGHDFCAGNWEGGVKYGVIEAVYQFCVERDWEIIYITSDIKFPSFALKRL